MDMVLRHRQKQPLDLPAFRSFRGGAPLIIAEGAGDVKAAPGGKIVCLDPGHPSENGWGTRGKRITEVRAAWLIALQTRARLEDAGVRVVLTKRRQDERVTNRRRAEIANRAGADLMVRLHCDAQGGSGTATFYPDRTGVVAGVRGPAEAVRRASGTAARRFHPALIRALGGALRDRGLRTDAQTHIGGKQGALTGSIFSEVPVLLVEMAVLTDPDDEAFLASEAGRRRMAEAIAAGVLAALR